MRPTFGKVSLLAFLVGLALMGAFLVRSNYRPAQNLSTAESPPEAAVFDEAARKRFPIGKADILSQVAPKDQTEVKTSLSREMMISKLMGEALDHRPELLAQAKSQVDAKKPEILRLKQLIHGETFEAALVVADTRPCRSHYEGERVATVSLTQLFETYCIDPNFDYPGGFGNDAPIEVTILPMSSLAQWEGLDNDYDLLVKTELRRLIVQDFAQRYSKTGSLTYAP